MTYLYNSQKNNLPSIKQVVCPILAAEPTRYWAHNTVAVLFGKVWSTDHTEHNACFHPRGRADRVFKQRAPIKTALFVGFFILLGLFAFSRAYNMLYGPRIVISEPFDGESLSNNLVTIRGTVANAALIHLNGRKIFTDPNGVFSEDVLLQDGYNVVSLSARDRFGRNKDVQLHLVYNRGLSMEVYP